MQVGQIEITQVKGVLHIYAPSGKNYFIERDGTTTVVLPTVKTNVKNGVSC